MVLDFIRSIACMLFFSDVYEEMIEISWRKSRKWSKVTRASIWGTPKIGAFVRQSGLFVTFERRSKSCLGGVRVSHESDRRGVCESSVTEQRFPPRSAQTHETKAWGGWATLGLGVGVAVVAQVPALIACSFRFGPDVSRWPDLEGDPIAVILLICVSTPAQVALLVWLSRRRGGGAAAYLAVRPPGRQGLASAIVLALALIAVADGFALLSGRNLDAPFQRDLVRSAIAASVAPFLWLTFVAMAPIAEETLFRGFLFRGWSGPARGPWFPIAATALTWTAAHVQYNLIALSQVLAAGLAFGWVRWRTGRWFRRC
jgi:membrane protease YdiL (CAAX protease family)